MTIGTRTVQIKEIRIPNFPMRNSIRRPAQRSRGQGIAIGVDSLIAKRRLTCRSIARAICGCLQGQGFVQRRDW